MGPTKKSRVVNKCSSEANKEWPDNDGTSTNNRKIRKRKLSDVLGSRWSKEDLEHFYEAYCRYGKDWKKVAAVVRNRSIDMVEALYNMNREYLSLPEGTATAAGLVARMTDHYNILDGSERDRESNQVLKASHKPQKRGRGKPQLDMPKGYEGPHPDYLQKQSAVSSSGHQPLLKNHFGDLFGGNRLRAVGKRTPRIPVPLWHDNNERNNTISPQRRDLNFRVDAAADEGVHGTALALAEASQRGKPSQIAETCDNKAECVRSSPMWSGKTGHAEPGNGASKIQRKVKKLQEKKSKGPGIQIYQFDDAREACSGAEEGHDVRHGKHEIDAEVRDRKTAIGLQGSSHEFLSPDESCALDALQALADLPVKILLPDSASKSGSSEHANEQNRSVDSAFTSNMPGSMSAKQESDKSRISVIKDAYSSDVGVHVVRQKSVHKNLSPGGNSIFEATKADHPSISKMLKRKRKRPAEMVSVEEGKTSSGGQLVPLAKQQSPGCSYLSIDLGRGETSLTESTPQVSAANHPSMPTSARNKRKISLQKAMAQRKYRFSDGVGDQGLSGCSHFANSKAADLKGKISHCLSLQFLRRWCAFEWFYSALDYPWFSRSEYMEYLNYVGLGHVPRLTRCERSIVRSSLGKPRRLSERFLLEEREKLNQYRESVRTYYDELRAGVREGLPADLARPLSVGQRVIARHPRKGEIHDGSILTVDRDRCRVQFDRPDLGVEFVMDIDCMPLNPWENMPEDLRKQNGVNYHLCNNFTGKKPDGHIMELKMDSSAKFSPKKSLVIADGTSIMASTKYPCIALNEQAKGDMKDANALGKYSASEVAIVAQHMICDQPCTSAQIQEREADIRALAELNCALKKKEALLMELREMNEEVAGKKNDGDSERDLGHFRKQYAMVLLQLQEARDQVGSALLVLRQRNTFHGISASPLHRSMENSGLAGCSGSFNTYDLYNHDTGSHVVEIVENSMSQARKMVDVTVQAMSSLRDGEDALTCIGEAIESKNNQCFGTESSKSRIRYIPHPGNFNNQNQAVSCILQPATTHALSPRVQFSYAIPSELISSCVATFLMIQDCAARQYPPAEVAQILEYAVTSLQPCCSQNLPIYREIETCMGIIKNQMLALIPSLSTTFCPEVSV
ncbi:protein ALWAYS EARLY 3-like isoform X2 [Phoenix dactylifera]|uniref:Protein ALWAYS EARLY 3-like isoform X2 n=1 Tax=Phoenix dactylifera TaxID=42345 RepID=A0A8B9AFS0_PHODC|nr:protein ALWAYS EARLY 3-like isoform X2 [Phoenix dactylifera]